MSLVRRIQQIAMLLVLPALLALTGCESQEAGPAPDAAESADHSAPATDGVASVDADGNIAPFGFASRKPVPIEEPLPDAPPPPTAANSELFAAHCVACHGADANGVEGLGVSLRGSQFVAESDETQLIVFLELGRPLDAPDNVTGVPMPAFSWMENEQLQQVAAYLKSL